MNIVSSPQELAALDDFCARHFAVGLKSKEMIVRNVNVGVAAQATVFKAGGQLYVLVMAQSGLLLADVQKIVRGMNCTADKYLPPRGDDEYFARIGTAKFQQLFPGKHIAGHDDIRYYETLASYNPALVSISKVDGSIRGYTAATRLWRKVRDYSYSKMAVRES